jgi:hypothetical protein
MSRDRIADFLEFSSALTGFSVFELRGTRQAESYLDTLDRIVGAGIVDEMTEAFARVRTEAGNDDGALERGLRTAILSDDKLGPVTRNLIKLWYVGTWHELPQDWRDVHGTNPEDKTHVVSPTAYTEGLLWPAIGANPSGAKPFGYGTWATPPRVRTSEAGEASP